MIEVCPKLFVCRQDEEASVPERAAWVGGPRPRGAPSLPWSGYAVRPRPSSIQNTYWLIVLPIAVKLTEYWNELGTRNGYV